MAAAAFNPPPMPSLPHLCSLPSAQTWGISLEAAASLFWVQNSVCEQHQRVPWSGGLGGPARVQAAALRLHQLCTQ